MYGFVNLTERGTQSTSLSIQTLYNGINLDEILSDEEGSFMTLTVSGRSNFSNRIDTQEVAGLDGLLESGEYTINEREITVKYKIFDITNEGFRRRFNQLNGILTGSKKVLVFSDEDAFFYATPSNNNVPEEESNTLIGSITFLCSDPYKYGPEREHIITPGINEILNDGSAETSPIFQLEATKETPFIDIVTEDGYMRLGEVPAVDDTVYNPYQILFEDYGSSVVGWAKTTFDNGFSAIASDGEILSSGEVLYPQSYGTGGQSNWYGPAIARSVGEQVQDFEIRVSAHQVASVLSEVGRAELYALDVNNVPIARLAIVKATHGRVSTCECVIYDDAGNQYTDLLKIDTESVPNWTDFTGHVVFRREGQSLSSYAALTSGPLGREKEKRTGPFHDGQNRFQRKLASIAIVFQRFGTKPTLNRNRITYELAMKISQQQGIKNIVQPGEFVEIDHNTSDIRINGETRLIKTFGSRFFDLKPGVNCITVEPSDALTGKILWRGRLK
jgi:predicted phage tail component-like protein